MPFDPKFTPKKYNPLPSPNAQADKIKRLEQENRDLAAQFNNLVEAHYELVAQVKSISP